MQLSKQIKIVLIYCLLLFFSNELLGKDTYCPVDSLLGQVIKEENVLLGEEFRNAELDIDELIETMDTACVIKVCRNYIRTGSNSYNLIFKTLWRALLLADESNSDVEKFKVNLDIARFYGYLKRYDKAKEHFANAGELKKKLTATNELTNAMEQKFYLTQVKAYRSMKDFERADIYLDSCYHIVDSSNLKARYYFLEFERGIKVAREQQYEEALSIFKKALDTIKVKTPGFQSIIFYNMGKAYRDLSQIEKSIEYFQKSIEVSKKYQKHFTGLPSVYTALANVKYEIGNYQEAYHLLQESQKVVDQYFDSRSEENSNLLNVQDDFRIYKEKQEERIQKSELENLTLQRILLIGSLLFLSTIAFVYFKLQKGKMKVEKALNNQLQIQNTEKEQFLKRIEKKNEELMTFSNIMSHDLKAPIRNISAFSGLIKKQFKNGFDKDKVSKFNDFIDSSAKSMSVLIEDLLLYSRINLDEQELTKVDLNEVIDLVYPAFSYDVNTGYASVNIEKLPTILGNKGLLKTVFHNLISNAIKYQPKDDPNHKAKVNIWSVEEQNEHCIYIEDNGIGIQADFLDKLFNAFSRYHNSSEYSGTGLGMSICKRIMTNHHGSIQLVETSSEGSKFKLVFPVIEIAETQLAFK